MPMLTVKIRRQAEMNIVLKYERVPYFCFDCGRMGHAARSCQFQVVHDLHFGKELRASPHKCIREIVVQAPTPRVARVLNYAENARRSGNSAAGSTSDAPCSQGPRTKLHQCTSLSLHRIQEYKVLSIMYCQRGCRVWRWVV